MRSPSLLITLAVIAGVLGLYASDARFFELLELRTYDMRFLWRGPLEPSPEVVVVAIDEKSLDAEGRWPWSRQRIADLVDALDAQGAKVIAFDVGFIEAEESAASEWVDALEHEVEARGLGGAGLDELIEAQRRAANRDARLADAIRRAKAEVVLGYFFHMRERDLHEPLVPEEIARRIALLDGSQYELVLRTNPELDDGPVLRGYAPEATLPELAQAADGAGYFSLRPGIDGVTRTMPLVIGAGEAFYPPLALAAVWHYRDDEPVLAVNFETWGVDRVQLGDLQVPTRETGELFINHLGPSRTFPYLSASDVLRGRVEPGALAGRIALVGATATAIYDLRTTPFDSVLPGPEIQATVIDNLLTGRFITRPDWTWTLDTAAIVLLAALVALASRRLGAVAALLVVAGLAGAYLVFARELFVGKGVWVNLVYPLLAALATYTWLTAYSYVREARERRRVKGVFGQYVSPEVVEQILDDPEALKLGGEEKELTVLFSDLAGFTAFSEQFAPSEVIGILSDYYARMTEQVFEHQGMLKEYVGDEMMAIFGAPIEQPDHARRACAAALDMQAKRRTMSEEWVAQGRPALHARTGINTGVMLVGNLGSEYRFSYGTLGDNVNLGSRLEGLNKAYRTEILVGENTARSVAGDFVLREVDRVRVVGKQEPVGVYELLARADAPLAPERTKALAAFAAGLEAFRVQRWAEAKALFHEALEHWPQDGPSRTLLERCGIYEVSPPPEGWDGVFVSTEK